MASLLSERYYFLGHDQPIGYRRYAIRTAMETICIRVRRTSCRDGKIVSTSLDSSQARRSQLQLARPANPGQSTDLRDLVVSHMLPLLEKLAAVDGRKWDTLQDYLDTPTVKLRFFNDEVFGDAVARVMQEPERHNAPYYMQPQPLSALSIPPDMPQISAENILVLDHHNGTWDCPPEQVGLRNTGQVASLLLCERPRVDEEGIVSNSSLDGIATMMKLRAAGDAANLLRPLAVITIREDSDTEFKTAGILTTWVPEGAERLSDLLPENLATAKTQGLTATWRDQLQHALGLMHSCGVIQSSVHQHNIWIDREQMAWLDIPGRMSGRYAGIDDIMHGPHTTETDFQRLDHVFEVWLRQRIESKEHS